MQDNMQGFFFTGKAEDNYIGHILAEIYKDRVYAPILEGKKDLTIIDVGANVGLTTYYFSQFASKVISLEPSKDHFACLLQMLDYNKIKNVIPLNMALYMTDGEFELGHNQNKTMYSLHLAVKDNSLPSEQVPAVSFATLFKDQKLDHVDFVKLDVEGSEYEILGHSTFAEVAPKIDSMLIEAHAWAGRHPNQLKESLKNRGFLVDQVQNDASLFFAHK